MIKIILQYSPENLQISLIEKIDDSIQLKYNKN